MPDDVSLLLQLAAVRIYCMGRRVTVIRYGRSWFCLGCGHIHNWVVWP